MSSILENLNPAQREAVLHGDGPLLIFAGAGSGKTRVLTHRIAYLIRERGVSPWHILAVTFTNKAAKEMKGRVEALVGGSVARDMWLGTFHAMCARILRVEADAAGLNSDFTIYDTGDQTAIVKECLKELGLGENQNVRPAAILGLISKAKENLIGPEAYRRHYGGSPMEDIAARAYRMYQERLLENGALDFDDLIMQAVLLLRRNTEVLAKYSERFRYVLVDEYQDINNSQYELVKLLAGGHRNLCVVGDDDQSVYGWRGANVRLILRFETDYPDAAIVKLEQNYRSTANILEAAHAVVSKNRSRRDKKLWTEAGAGELIHLHAANNEREEAMWIAERILDGRAREKRRWQDFTILYRTNFQSRVFEDVFLKYRIPYRIIGGLRFFERKEVKDIVAYLRLALNPHDAVSLRRVINLPQRGIGATSFGRIEAFASTAGISLFDACRQVESIPDVQTRTKRAVAGFVALVDRLRAASETLPVPDLAKMAMEESGYLDMLREDRSQESETREENLMEFLSAARDFGRGGEDDSLRAFLENVSLMSDADEMTEDDDAVVLMTLHTAKGLEFPVVFMVGMEEGVFPHNRSLTDEDELAEERRLAYVGITRARERLFMTFAFTRQMFGSCQTNAPSRFLADIPDSVLKGRPPRTIAAPWSGGPRTGPSIWEQMQKKSVEGPRPARPAPVGDSPFKVGTKVRHAKFGEGTVVAVSGSGDDAQVSVAFPGDGIRKLLVSMAKLERV
jgi:DNA helicase-2/ATP-dependent DNA helicase PcrA